LSRKDGKNRKLVVIIPEPECVLLKRRGAEYVRQLTAGMSVREQLEFWRKRTEAMLERQKKVRQNIEEEARN
jgi:hypothetical protein